MKGSNRTAPISRSRRSSRSRPERFIPARSRRGDVSPPPTGPKTKGIPKPPMNDVEGHHLMKLSRAVISPKLPGQVVEIEAAGPRFPLSAPCRKVMVRNGYGNRERLNFPLDDCPVVFARDHRNVVTLPDELKHPVPSDSGLRALMGLTGVGGKKNLHR